MLTGRGEARRGKKLGRSSQANNPSILSFFGLDWTVFLPDWSCGVFYHIFPCRSVFLLELTLSSGERGREGRESGAEKGYTYLPSCSGLFCFFLLWIAFLSSLFLSLSPPPPLPLPLFFFREGKTLLSSRLELLLSAYLAILLSSSSSSSHHHHHHHQSSWVSWKRLCKSYIPPSRPVPCLASTI